MRDPIFNPDYLAQTMRGIHHQRTQFENAYRPALKYFKPEQLPSILSAPMPPPSLEGQQIEFIVWLNPYFKDRTISAIAVRLDGVLVWAYLAIRDEFLGKQRILS